MERIRIFSGIICTQQPPHTHMYILALSLQTSKNNKREATRGTEVEDSQAAERLLSLSLMKGATLWKRRSAQRSQPVGPNAIEQTWSQLAKLGKPPKCTVTCATMQKGRASCSDGAAPCARRPAQARPAPSDSLPACRRRPGPFSSCLCISLPCSSHQLWVRWTPFPFSFFSAALSEQRGENTQMPALLGDQHTLSRRDPWLGPAQAWAAAVFTPNISVRRC